MTDFPAHTDPNDDIRTWRGHRPPWTQLGLLYVAYVLTGSLGEGLALIPGVSILFWPPVGVLIATLLLTSRASWPWWIAAACLAELSWNALHWHNPWYFALVYFSGNALEALTAAWLINRYGGRPFRLETLREVAALVVLGAGVAPMVSATVIAGTDALIGKHEFTTAWPLVWLGDGTGLLISTPLTLVAVQAWRERAHRPSHRSFEAVLTALVVVTLAGFALNGTLPTVYVALPAVLWAAVRFQLRGAAAAVGLLTLVTAIFTASGVGQFVGDPESMRDGIVELQAFLAVTAISAFLVATLSRERQEALHDLQTLNSQLESRVAERTAALHARESDLQSALEALRGADRQKDEFLAMLAHELRNPLSAIRNAGEWLVRTFDADARVQKVLPILNRQTQLLTRLVDDLLDVSRIAQGRIVLQEEPLEIGAVVQQAVETVQLLIREKSHRLTVDGIREPVYVRGDRGRLAQSIGNVLHNAAKYTDDGGEIRIEVRPEGGEVAIQVRDNGIGIGPELLPRVFDLFVQSERTLDRAQGGLGIGLSVVKRLVEMHGGTVGAMSAGAGQGSAFTIRLPRIEAPAIAPTPARVTGPCRRVLVVDDNADAAESLAIILRLQGHEVRAEYGAAAALEAAQRDCPDVVLLDIGLPSMDGYEVARRMRSDARLAATRIVALTGYGQPADKERARRAGFDAHLIKPLDFDALERILAEDGPPAPQLHTAV
jgi:signal transduction histidine kinase/ActR/RegA family two-component response regulator